MQGEVAASRPGVQATVLYTQTAGPLKNRHARGLAEEAKANGLSLIKTNKIPLHGKVVAWDDDDVVVTSLTGHRPRPIPTFPGTTLGFTFMRRASAQPRSTGSSRYSGSSNLKR
jgi:cardiolipin synthase A/B